MRKVLVFHHVAREILGTFHPLLKKSGFRIRYANFGRLPHPTVDTKNYDGLIILGGPMGVYETQSYPHLADEMAIIREIIQQDKPVLGICLGAQLIAAALGAVVAPNPDKEIGWYEVGLTEEGRRDPVLSEMKQTEKIFQWHGDAFQLPKDAVWLATSPTCRFQAFRYATKVYGFQFHLEVDEPMIERWLTLPAHAPILDGLQGGMLPQRIRLDTPKYIERQKELSGKVFSRYLELCGLKRKCFLLGSKHRTDF